MLSYGPRVLVLDEPTVGQDARNRELLRRIIRNLVSSGRTVVVVTHDLDFIWPLDPRTIVIRSGRILADTRLSRVISDGMLMESAHLVQPWLPSSIPEEESAQRVDGPVR